MSHLRLNIDPLPAQRRFFNSDLRYRGFVGGLGSGKTVAGTLEVFRQPAGSRGMVVAPSYKMLQDAVLDTFYGFTDQGAVLREFNKENMRAVLPNNTTVLFRSGDNPETLRGPNLGWFYLDEAALMPKDVWDIMIGRLRKQPARAWITTTPKGKNWIYDLFVGAGYEDYGIFRCSSRENIHNPESFVKNLERNYTSTFQEQEIEGRFLDVKGALWKQDTIDMFRVKAAPEMKKIMLGVDPSGGKTDETGIIVGGLGVDNQGYILADESIKGSAAQWGQRVCDVFRQFEAILVVAEVNYGGDMVKHTIQTIDPSIPVKTVHATRGKDIRAQPVAALYENGKIHHEGYFPELEAQMTTFDPNDKKQKSPDRMDAMVWIMKELLVKNQVKIWRI